MSRMGCWERQTKNPLIISPLIWRKDPKTRQDVGSSKYIRSGQISRPFFITANYQTTSKFDSKNKKIYTIGVSDVLVLRRRCRLWLIYHI